MDRQILIKPSAENPTEFPDEPEACEASPPRPTSKSAVRRVLQALNPTLKLENTGSVARDHLASERTWLAYVRTSLGIANTGVALVQLFTIPASPGDISTKNARLDDPMLWFVRSLGAAAVFLGLSILIIGALRYFKIQKAMMRGQFPVACRTVVFITALLAMLVAVTFGILVTGRRGDIQVLDAPLDVLRVYTR